jgi:predicted O-methyltransferase YrrM
MGSVRSILKTAVPTPVRGAIRDRQLDRSVSRAFFADSSELDEYRRELDGLRTSLERSHARFYAELGGSTVRGHPVSFGNLAWGSSGRLYALVRKLKPATLVETGVCNGVSTSVLLLALEHNGAGHLWSIDYPEYIDGSGHDFSETKLGAVVPPGKESGWLVPDHLRPRWDLIVGKSQEELPPLLERLGTIDFFMHDSEHSYECMTFEMTSATEHLASGGLLVVDDSRWNSAFEDFVRERGLPRHDLGGGTEATVV